MSREFFTKNENETRKLAKILAQEIIKSKKACPEFIEGALIIGLEGELGSGKTTFIQSFAKGLSIKSKITSPTFVLMKKYKPRKKPEVSVRGKNFYHIDCYRIKSYKDILALDFQEIISNPQNIIVIEWAEKIRKILPKDTIWIYFKIISNKEREIKIYEKISTNRR